MTIHYLITAHHRFDLLRNLIQALLTDESARVWIHVDAKSTYVAQEKWGDRVNWVPDRQRVPVTWATWSQVAATLELCVMAATNGTDDDRVVFLSGDSFPLASPTAISKYFSKAGNAEFINRVSMPSVDAGKPLTRLSAFYLPYDPRTAGHHLGPRLVNRLRVPQPYRRALRGRQPFGGSNWWALTLRTVRFAVCESSRDTKLIRLAKHTAMPDEWYFQTVLGPHLADSLVRRAPVYADFTKSGPKPAYIDEDILARLVNRQLRLDPHPYGDGTALFARKYNSLALHQATSFSWTRTDRFLEADD